MPDQLQLRGGTTVQHSTFTGASKEVTVDTTKKTAIVHDGATAGGNPLMREDASNAALALGSAATPSLKFTGDTNTGIYSPGADQVAISTNGTGRLFVDASGSVNIDSNTLYVDAVNNRVGIGTSAPGSPLTIQGNYTGTSNMLELRTTAGGVDGGGRIVWKKPQDEFLNSFISSSRVGANSTSQIEFGTAADIYTASATTKMVISGSGAVGIGTTAPGYLLDVNGAAAVGIGAANGNNYEFRVRAGTSGLSRFIAADTSDAGYIDYEHSNDAWSFKTAGTERLRIDSSGRLLVGTSTARGNFFNTSYTPQLQLEGVGQQQSMFSLVNSVADNGGPVIALGKQRSGTIGGNTIVNAQDVIGTISFQASDGTELVTAASIDVSIDGTPGTNDMPGRLVFSTTADGAANPTERMRIKSTGIINFSNAPTYADNTAATAAGLAVGDVYKTVVGVLMIRF